MTTVEAALSRPDGHPGSAPTPAAPAGRRRARPAIGAKAAVVACDVVAVAAGLLAAYLLRRAVPLTTSVTETQDDHALLGALAVPVWLFSLAHYRLYSSRYIARATEEIRRLAGASVVAALIVAALGYSLDLQASRAWLLASLLFSLTLLVLERQGVRAVFGRVRRKGRLLRRVVIVGSNGEARELAEMLMNDPTLGYRVVGFVSDGEPCSDPEILGTLAEALHVVRATNASGVIVATTSTSAVVCNRLVRELVNARVHVELTSSLRDVDAGRLTVRPLGPFPVTYLEPRHIGGWRAVAKRAFDLTLASAGLLLVAPVALVIALAIKLDSRGPVLFKQTRVGRGGDHFQVLKFRTMVRNAEELLIDLRDRNEADGPLFKLRDDPRGTRVGKLLRKTSLDELPQLWNVIRGEMSLVGPRPALPDEALQWDDQLRQRLTVRPGISGMWQVNGRSNASFDAYSRLDLYYVDNWSLVTDLAILAKTVPAVLGHRGAY